MAFEYSLVLQNGLRVYVDEEDYNQLNKYNWYMRKVFSKSGKLKSVPILTGIKNEHGKSKDKSIIHFILDLSIDEMVIHLNGNYLDYRKENLKIINKKEHNFYKKAVANTSSKYKGVTLDKRHNTWVSQTKVKGNRIYIGSFKSEDEAAKSYNKFITDTFGEDTDYYLNVIGTDNRKPFIDESVEESTSKKYLKRTQKIYRNTLYSKYRGVSVKEGSNGSLIYVGEIQKDNVRFPLGSFEDEKECARVYNEAFMVLYGEDYSEDEIKKYLNTLI